MITAQKGKKLSATRLDKNLPVVAGTLMWSRKLRLRIEEPIDGFFELEIP
jgi:hypothetical protein